MERSRIINGNRKERSMDFNLATKWFCASTSKRFRGKSSPKVAKNRRRLTKCPAKFICIENKLPVLIRCEKFRGNNRTIGKKLIIVDI